MILTPSQGSDPPSRSTSISVELPQPSDTRSPHRTASPTARTASRSPANPLRHRRTATPTVQGACGQHTPSPDLGSDDSSHPSSRTRTPLPSGGRGRSSQRSRSRSANRSGARERTQRFAWIDARFGGGASPSGNGFSAWRHPRRTKSAAQVSPPLSCAEPLCFGCGQAKSSQDFCEPSRRLSQSSCASPNLPWMSTTMEVFKTTDPSPLYMFHFKQKAAWEDQQVA